MADKWTFTWNDWAKINLVFGGINSNEVVSSSKYLWGIRSVFLRHIVQYNQIKCKLLMNSCSTNYGCFGAALGRCMIRISAPLLGCLSEYTFSREMPTRYLQIRHILPLPTLSAHHSWIYSLSHLVLCNDCSRTLPNRQYCFHFYIANRRCGRSITRDKVAWWLRVLLPALYL